MAHATFAPHDTAACEDDALPPPDDDRIIVTIARPTDLRSALDALADRPDAHLLLGGTDLQVEVNLGHRRPPAIVALRRVGELDGIEVSDEQIDIGAGVTYAQIEADLAADAPGLAMASRTVGSPQIRNLGTVGGNVGTSSPAGDALPWLLAMDAQIDLVAADGARTMALADFITGPKHNARAPGEIIHRIRVPRVAGPQHVAKIGPRNAMVIAVASVAMIIDTDNRRVRVAMGSVGPTPLRPTEAETAISQAIDWDAMTCTPEDVEAFARACAQHASPITDHRSTAEYRRHAVGVLANRTLTRCLFA
ncbi:MAG TPA: FAD binding domain-containing protein [Euzebya sp.]|nr:FAD binding domain-containing protein [Euzebya sp.]